jgi:hypothetical protein
MDNKDMPATKDRNPNGNFPPEIGRIIEKIKRRGCDSLSDGERVMVAQIFRTAAMTVDKRVIEIRDAIQKAHLEFCFRLEGMR